MPSFFGSRLLARLLCLTSCAVALAACASRPMIDPGAPPNAGPQGAPGTEQGCEANKMSDDALVGKPEAEAAALLQGCPWRIGQRDAQQYPGTMDYNPDRRTLGIAGGIVVWVRRG